MALAFALALTLAISLSHISALLSHTRCLASHSISRSTSPSPPLTLDATDQRALVRSYARTLGSAHLEPHFLAPAPPRTHGRLLSRARVSMVVPCTQRYAGCKRLPRGLNAELAGAAERGADTAAKDQCEVRRRAR
eukprot:2471600-Pleurochrysis_carterae.AAC.2